MTYTNLLCTVENGVATVTVNRPDKSNAMNTATIGELGACFASLQEDAAARVVVLTGAGEKAFVAGADINELADLKSHEGKSLAAGGQRVMNLIENLGKPVIAAVNGFALGGGLELAMACSFRYASANAKLGLPETGLGLIPGFGGTQRLPRLIGRGQALELILTGTMISAEDALRLGLVNRVLAPEELYPAVIEIAGQLASKSSLTLRLALQAVGDGLQMSQNSGCRLEAGLFGVCGATADAREGCSAFLEKRKPEFKDR